MRAEDRGLGPFWLLFAVGWALFAVLALTNGGLVTAASPGGVLDHQVAGSAARVDEIQAAWRAAGALPAAQFAIGLDLAFIGVLTAAGTIGGVRIAQGASGPVVRALGAFAAVAFLAFGLADYAETIAQFVQVNAAGDDDLARLAATANPPKITAFLAAHVALAGGLAGRWLARRRAAGV
ncbi:MAG: hypothetical protein NW200_06070 [Hyphomonadaceae bacterium]|nr:hypothetical protein [Hyphomonadaceae bacterium]